MFERELSVIANPRCEERDVTYPVCENEHRDGILAMTIVRAHPDEVAARAQMMAAKLGGPLGIVGTYCVEFFLHGGSELLVKRCARRTTAAITRSMRRDARSTNSTYGRSARCRYPADLFSSAIMMNVLGTGTATSARHSAAADRSVDRAATFTARSTPSGSEDGPLTMLLDGPVDDTRSHAPKLRTSAPLDE